MGFVDWAEAARVQTSDTTPMMKPGICDCCIPLQLERTIPKGIDSRQILTRGNRGNAHQGALTQIRHRHRRLENR
jgi:hypothetical protein